MKYGYAYLAEHCCRGAFSPRVPAQVSRSAKALTQAAGVLWVPEALLPAKPSVLDHALFALKHEGTNLQILSEVLPQIERAAIEARLPAAPNSVPARKLAYLWEAFTGGTLEAAPVSARYAGLFDPNRYFTVPGERCRKWRIVFNGLGNLRWCATVEKTPRLLRLLADDPLARAGELCSRLDPLLLDRLQGWSYLAEARGSFSLEREALSVGRADRFVSLMKSAEASEEFSEAQLARWRNGIPTDASHQEAGFRTRQNWLANRGRGVAYVPPPPAMLPNLMAGWLEAANALTQRVHPLIATALLSFGFVYLHPFMDGNGRLSRVLIGALLSRSGRLPKGMILPISAAMSANPSGFLETLDAFSQPARARWRVTGAGGAPAGFEFLGTADMYRFWDATAQAEFLVRMAKASLEFLREGCDHLARFDRLDRALNEAFDLVQTDRHALVWDFLEQGAITGSIRSRFARSIPSVAMDWLASNGREIASGKA